MISIRGLQKSFKAQQGRVDALKGIDLEVGEGEFCVLLGPSGCGKTTTLRCVAGLERPDGGEIEIGGRLVNSPGQRVFVPTEKREIGMVFQSYAIWPHMSVFQNIAFPLTQGQKHFSKNVVVDKVRSALKRVQLDDLEQRPATDLSGGQQQRVAMARAMVTDSKVLLMDEPLSNLDAWLREQMRVELKKITKSIGVTTLYVTHDQAEALSLGDKFCVMNQGEILQMAEPRDIYAHPVNLFVAQFVGEMNFVKGHVAGPCGGEIGHSGDSARTCRRRGLLRLPGRPRARKSYQQKLPRRLGAARSRRQWGNLARQTCRRLRSGGRRSGGHRVSRPSLACVPVRAAG